MQRLTTAIPDVLVFEPTLHGDSRGYFMETWRQSDFEDLEKQLDELDKNDGTKDYRSSGDLTDEEILASFRKKEKEFFN